MSPCEGRGRNQSVPGNQSPEVKTQRRPVVAMQIVRALEPSLRRSDANASRRKQQLVVEPQQVVPGQAESADRRQLPIMP